MHRFLTLSALTLMTLNLAAESSTFPSVQEEAAASHLEAMKISAWWSTERFNGVVRPYTPERVASLRETLHQEYPSNAMAKKAWKLFKELQAQGNYSHTFGALDPVQIVEMAPYLTTVYVSGWQSSSTASSSNEPGPDFADYPMDTVPRKVHQLFEAERFHDRKQNEARSRLSAAEKAQVPSIDYLRPIIADADTGHGGLSAVMKLTKMFIQFGAAGIHLEDQKPGTKKCGHMSGKVLVSTQEHCDRLIATRLQADILGSELIIVARTDAEGANLLDTNIDPRDHTFILGATRPMAIGLAELVRLGTEKFERKQEQSVYSHKLAKLQSVHPLLAERVAELWIVQDNIQAALNLGQSTSELEKQESAALNILCEAWNSEANLKTYYATVKEAIENSPYANKEELVKAWHKYNDPLKGVSRHDEPLNALSHSEAVELAKKLGIEVHWDWESPRTFEGYYQIRSGVDMCIARGRDFATYSDMIWMETASPSLEEAKRFSDGVKMIFPDKLLAYNLSPSFNWDKFGLTDDEIAAYQDHLGRLGYVWQFITLAGFHGDALFAKTFAEDFSKRKMLAYVDRVQRVEREKKVGALTHQKWSGVDLIGSQQDAATLGRSSTGASGKKSTEHQFTKTIADKH